MSGDTIRASLRRPPAAGPLRACIFWRTGVETLTGGGSDWKGRPTEGAGAQRAQAIYCAIGRQVSAGLFRPSNAIQSNERLQLHFLDHRRGGQLLRLTRERNATNMIRADFLKIIPCTGSIKIDPPLAISVTSEVTYGFQLAYISYPPFAMPLVLLMHSSFEQIANWWLEKV